jgi:predicted AAA+ superfamily ATPase
VKKENRASKTVQFSQKLLPSSPVFVSFLLPIFLENRSALFETYAFVNILRILNFS